MKLGPLGEINCRDATRISRTAGNTAFGLEEEKDEYENGNIW